MFDIIKFFEKLGEIVYISDIETKELVYINEIGRKTFGIYSEADYKNRKCYEVLYGFDLPCSTCDMEILTEDEFLSYISYNTKLKKYFRLKNTIMEIDNRFMKFEIAIDIDDQQRQRNELETVTFNERIINEAMKLALQQDDSDKSIYAMMQYLGEQFECDRVYIFEENEDHSFSNTFEWCKANVSPEIHNLQNLPYSVVKVWYDEFDKNNNIIISDIEEYKYINRAMYDVLKPQNIKTLVVGPLIIQNRKIGFYGVDNPPVFNINSISVMYQVLGNFISSLMRQRENMKELERAGFTDYLTGLPNRRALDEFISEVDKEKSIAMIFCDLNGLKDTNDNIGHYAGDNLIKKAAGILIECYGRKRVFRMGGDEFLTMFTENSEADLDFIQKNLRERFDAENISASIGSLWLPRMNMTFDQMFKEVDIAMYEDKHRYYSKHERRGDRRKL
ncbi:MAG: sensor domain-containing diguanylate cyclase [Anaerovoracaceae bacterium]